MMENLEVWARAQFTDINLGDKRLNNRAQIIAVNMVKKPSESINMQNESWKDSKAAYNFFNSNKVEFQELIRPHKKLVKSQVVSLEQVLAIQDTCYISYSHHPSVKGLGHIGPEDSKGIILHNTIAVDPRLGIPKVIGILDQWTHNRNNDTDDDWTENKLWQEASSRINIDTKKTQVIEIMDREGCTFDIMKNCLSLNHDFVIRSKEGKIVRTPFRRKLVEACSKVIVAGHLKLKIQKKKGQTKRIATLEVKYLSLEIPGPPGRKDESLECNIVQVIEINPPKDQEPISWFLLTSVKVESFEDAILVIEWYKHRWIIEEYHKCIKTGCKVESKQLKESFRLENYLGIAGVIAMKILQLRDLVRIMPNKLASEIFDPISITVLQAYSQDKNVKLTVKEYYILVAKMGGFLNRKSDGNPGWQTLWKGQQQLIWMVKGAKAMLESMKTYG